MYPFLLDGGALGVRLLSTQAMLVVAMLAAVWLAPRFASTLGGLDRRAARRACVFLALVALLGSRVLFLLHHGLDVLSGSAVALGAWSGGRHAPGAVIALLLAGPFICRRQGLPFARFADCGVIALGVGLAITRVGCFLHGCCFGTVCTAPWCVTFPPTAPAYGVQAYLGILPAGATRSLPVHPLQLYFAAAALLIAGVARWHQPRRRFDGEVMLVSLVLFSVSSLGLEFLRQDYVGRAYLGALPQLAWTGLGMTAVSVAALAFAEAREALRSRGRPGARVASAQRLASGA